MLYAGKERNRLSLLTSPKESRAGVREHGSPPGPETLAMVEGMAHRLLGEDEVAAVMRHCRRVSPVALHSKIKQW